MLEERGLATTVLALVLPQVEKTRPPRALMTPFMLGRPLGEPNDAAFQTRVLMQALHLLTREDGPVILEHFPDETANWFDRPDFVPAVAAPEPGLPRDTAGWEAAFAAELALVLPAWERFKARFGRTTVGLAGQAPADWPRFAASFLDGALPTLAMHATPALALRFLADDLKALYGEAVQADGAPPSAAPSNSHAQNQKHHTGPEYVPAPCEYQKHPSPLIANGRPIPLIAPPNPTQAASPLGPNIPDSVGSTKPVAAAARAPTILHCANSE